jgi:5-methylcytosine-specific restriction enzyme subunit McrC
VVRQGVQEFCATQHVGVFRLGDRTIQVLPKIYRSAHADAGQRAREATHNLLHLLQIAGDVPVREHGLASLLCREMDWFEIMTRLFATHLREEWQRGASRDYALVEDDQPCLKGRWRVSEQLRRPGRDHIFAVAYDEFTADIPLNRVFRFVVERLWKVTRDGENRRLLGELRQWLDEVTLLPALPPSAANPTLVTRLNRRLEPLLNLARLFLDGRAMQLSAGDLSTFAFVFDMNQVFEAFIVNLVRRHRDEILPAHLRGCDLLPQASGAALYLARSDGEPVFRLKPDLALRQGRAFPLLVDAKYKSPDWSAGGGVSRTDFYQMFAYAHRYDCPRVLMLYPQTADVPNALWREFALEGGGAKKVAVGTVDIRVDLGRAEGRKQVVERLRQIFTTAGAQP